MHTSEPRPAELIRDWGSERFGGVDLPNTARPEVTRALLIELVEIGLTRLPSPGGGHTWARFEALTALGEIDLTVARLAEAHADAGAILAELDPDLEPPRDSRWAVWAAEPRAAGVEASMGPDGVWRLRGRKAWCSGAGAVSHALVTARAADGPRLFAVDLSNPLVKPVDDPWPAAALSGTDTRSVDFESAAVTAVGDPNDYVDRAGFWYGAIGVAAVWYGGAYAVGDRLARDARRRGLGDLADAHLGAVSAALSSASSVLRQAAWSIDHGDAEKPPFGEILARAARASVEASAAAVISHVGRALGPAPLALDGTHARRVQDLELYLRQSHAEADLAELGRRVKDAGLPR